MTDQDDDVPAGPQLAPGPGGDNANFPAAGGGFNQDSTMSADDLMTRARNQRADRGAAYLAKLNAKARARIANDPSNDPNRAP
jgi:hypothetical protein